MLIEVVSVERQHFFASDKGIRIASGTSSTSILLENKFSCQVLLQSSSFPARID
jgi:hypothetical protein